LLQPLLADLILLVQPASADIACQISHCTSNVLSTGTKLLLTYCYLYCCLYQHAPRDLWLHPTTATSCCCILLCFCTCISTEPAFKQFTLTAVIKDFIGLEASGASAALSSRARAVLGDWASARALVAGGLPGHTVGEAIPAGCTDCTQHQPAGKKSVSHYKGARGMLRTQEEGVKAKQLSMRLCCLYPLKASMEAHMCCLQPAALQYC
jgi:hypothetical protein